MCPNDIENYKEGRAHYEGQEWGAGYWWVLTVIFLKRKVPGSSKVVFIFIVRVGQRSIPNAPRAQWRLRFVVTLSASNPDSAIVEGWTVDWGTHALCMKASILNRGRPYLRGGRPRLRHRN